MRTTLSFQGCKLPGQRTTHVAPLTTHAQTRWKCQVSIATALTEQWVLFLSQLQPPTMLAFSLFPILSLPLLSCFLLLSVRALCLRAYWVPKLSGNTRRPPKEPQDILPKRHQLSVCARALHVCVYVSKKLQRAFAASFRRILWQSAWRKALPTKIRDIFIHSVLDFPIVRIRGNKENPTK